MDSTDTSQSPYVSELKIELSKIDNNDFVHATRLLTEETKRVESGDKYKNVPMVELHHDKPHSNAVKIRIPVKEFPKVNFSGKLLGPKGSTLKQLQQETGCKLSILGKGSMRDKVKEEELRKEGGKYAHLNEELHLMVECFAETVDAYGRLANAITKLKEFMNPDADPQALQGMMAAQMDERGFFNGEGHAGRGGPGPRGAPGGRGGILNTPGGRGGMPPGRGGGSAPPVGRGTPPPRGGLAPRGAPSQRGAPPQRGAPAPRGVPPPRGVPTMRGAPAPRGAPPAGGAPVGRGAAPPSRGAPASNRGRAMPPPVSLSRAPPALSDYDDYGTESAYSQDPYAQSYTAQESYDDAYTRRDPYAEEAYQEPVSAAGDTQYFDYGHGAQSYTDEYDTSRIQSRPPPHTSGYDSRAMKAPPPIASRGARGARTHPYDTTARPGVAPSRYSSY